MLNMDELNDDEREIIEEVENMLVPELMTMIEVGEKEYKDNIDKFLHSTDEEYEDMIATVVGNLLTLRYYHQILDKKDVDNMRVGDLKKEYEEFAKKMENDGE